MPIRPRPVMDRREIEVLTLIARGFTNQEMATYLHLSPATIQGYADNLVKRLCARNREHAVHLAWTTGLLGPTYQRMGAAS